MRFTNLSLVIYKKNTFSFEISFILNSNRNEAYHILPFSTTEQDMIDIMDRIDFFRIGQIKNIVI